MKVTSIGLCPPPGAEQNPKVTPELLASCLARYSRSNKGIDAILGSIDWSDPERSVDAIFKFIDYGHASITGLTGGIAIAIDGCSMFLAFKLFEIAQLCDGQESSTRYIKLDESNIPDPRAVGIPNELSGEWKEFMLLSFRVYGEVYAKLDQEIAANPGIIKLPPGTDKKVADRIRKNYALDRARYFIPFATTTNAAYIMTARVWADTLRQLDSIPLPETHVCAQAIRTELHKFVPRMVKHGDPDQASTAQSRQMLAYALEAIRNGKVSTERLDDEVHVSIENNLPSFLPAIQTFEQACEGKVNRYSQSGNAFHRVFVRAAWNNMAIAELRDLARHRSGFRFSPLVPSGFYLPPGISHPLVPELLSRQKALIASCAQSAQGASYVYALLLGTQTPFEHSSHLDKFIYEIELRTGLGAHFRYAEHLSAIYDELVKQLPEVKNLIEIGNAEPEL